MEYGNTDTAGYVKDGGLLDVTQEFGDWTESKDADPTAKQSVTVDGKVYGAPFYVGVRALYYRTDVFEELGLEVPKTIAELATTAREIRAAKPELYGLVVGGAYTYGAMPFVWANGGELATGKGGSYASAVDGAAAQSRASRGPGRSRPRWIPSGRSSSRTNSAATSSTVWSSRARS